MSLLPGDSEAGERLKRQALRDFGPLPPDDAELRGTSYKLTVDADDAPVPSLFRYALDLIGLETYGPEEKVAWWVKFTYKGERCVLAHEKFGLRLYLRTVRPENEAHKTQLQIVKKLRASMRTVEKLIVDKAPSLLANGSATVVNQHRSLRRAYEYFRERTVAPAVVEDEYKEYGAGEIDGLSWSSTFQSGAAVMRLNAFHDMIAAITAYLSTLEHDLVLALAFCGFDPDQDSLTDVIGSRWGDKFDRLLGQNASTKRYRQRLTDVVERWRNPYSHGGFEKGNGATLYLHVPGVYGAVPIGMTNVRSSPVFSFMSASESEIAEVFELFDEVDAWLKSELPEAMQWIESGLNVPFSEDFRAMFADARTRDVFNEFLEYYEYRQAMVDNMDY